MQPEQPQEYEQGKEPKMPLDSEEHMEKLIDNTRMHLEKYHLVSGYHLTPQGIVDSKGNLIIPHYHDEEKIE